MERWQKIMVVVISIVTFIVGWFLSSLVTINHHENEVSKLLVHKSLGLSECMSYAEGFNDGITAVALFVKHISKQNLIGYTAVKKGVTNTTQFLELQKRLTRTHLKEKSLFTEEAGSWSDMYVEHLKFINTHKGGKSIEGAKVREFLNKMKEYNERKIRR